jgi:hypothetical protein
MNFNNAGIGLESKLLIDNDRLLRVYPDPNITGNIIG